MPATVPPAVFAAMTSDARRRLHQARLREVREAARVHAATYQQKPQSAASTLNPTERNVNPDLLYPTSEQWMSAAVCSQTDPELFFPDKGASAAPAKAACRSCPVANECLEYAVRNDITDGIFGGLTGKDRRGLRAAPAVREQDRQTLQAMRMRSAGAGWPEIERALGVGREALQTRLARYRARGASASVAS